MNKILAVDIGNTETVMGCYLLSDSDVRIEKNVRIPSDPSITADVLWSLISAHIELPKTIWVSSVVPPLVPRWRELAGSRGTAIHVVGPEDLPDLEIKIERPEEAGVDRLINSWTAFRRYGGPAVVVDMGTATTFDVVDGDGAYLGGAIAPGLKILPEALARKTARLPVVELEVPKSVIGKTTKQALQSGIVLGHLAMIEGLMKKITLESGITRFVATGGLCSIVAEEIAEQFEAVDPTLTLDGIALIARRFLNSEEGKGGN